MHGTTPPVIPAELLLQAYRAGVFPMADSREDPDLFWVEPRERAIIPLETFRPSRSLRKVLRQDRYRVTCDTAFAKVIEACAAPRREPGSATTADSWISHRIEASYLALHRGGHAHSIECWRDDGGVPRLLGGLYGVAFDRVFCGESMFSRADDASKVALAWLVAAMRKAGFMVLDCQFMTDHLASMGAIAIPQGQYLARIASAAGTTEHSLPLAFGSLYEEGVALGSPGKLIAQSFTQTS